MLYTDDSSSYKSDTTIVSDLTLQQDNNPIMIEDDANYNDFIGQVRRTMKTMKKKNVKQIDYEIIKDPKQVETKTMELL